MTTLLEEQCFETHCEVCLRAIRLGLSNVKKALHHVAKSLIKKAIGGDIQAIKEIGDRLDGKPAQAIIGPLGEPITLVERVIVVQAIEQPREAIDITDEVEVVQEQIEDKSANTNHI